MLTTLPVRMEKYAVMEIKAYLVLKHADEKAFISNCVSSRGLSWDIIVALRCQTIEGDKLNKILGCGSHTAFSLNAFVNMLFHYICYFGSLQV